MGWIPEESGADKTGRDFDSIIEDSGLEATDIGGDLAGDDEAGEFELMNKSCEVGG